MFHSPIAGRRQLYSKFPPHHQQALLIVVVVTFLCFSPTQQQQQSPDNSNNNGAAVNSQQSRRPAPDTCSTNYNFDELILSVQWPLSFCYQKHDHCALDIARKKRWQIHGLWPNKARGGNGKPKSKRRRSPNGNTFSNIEYCCGPAYEPKNINDKLYKELLEKWPTLNANGKHHAFWRHEFLKHGNCARNLKQLNTQNAYFQTALALYQRYDLNKSNLRNNQNYTLAQLHSAIDPIFGGKRPRIECSFVGAPGARNRQSIFSEVRICLDKNLVPKDCGQGDDRQCKAPIYMP